MNVWYPEFGLKKDPFGVGDYATEQKLGGGYPRIKTKATEKIVGLAKSQTNVVLAGPKGSGKTCAMVKAGEELANLGKFCFKFAGIGSLTDIYNVLWQEMCPTGGGAEEDKEKDKQQKRKLEDRLIGPDATLQVSFWFSGTRCKYYDCLKREKCLFERVKEPITRSVKGKYGKEYEIEEQKRTGDEIFWELDKRDDACPMKRKIVNKLFSGVARHAEGAVYLVDVPDDFLRQKYGRVILDELIEQFQALGTIVITATNEQYASIKKSESLARIQMQDFPLPSIEELGKIYVERVRAFQVNKTEPLPFSDKALNYLLDYSEKIPREFIRLCSKVLQTMKSEERREPADLDFIRKILGFKTQMTETDAIRNLLGYLRAEAQTDEKSSGWYKVMEMVVLLKERYGVKITERRLGRLLKNEYGLVMRHTPLTEYKVIA